MHQKLIPAAIVLAIGSAVFAAPSVAPATIIESREAGFKAMGAAYKALHDQFASGKPDTAIVQKNSALIASTAPNIVHWFPAGTGPDAGKTSALPTIWEKPDDFAAAARTLATESARLQMLAAAADMPGAAAQMKAVGGACGACHNSFRKKDS
jgi:cytochrome c556